MRGASTRNVDVASPSARTRSRRRPGRICSIFASARTDDSSMPAIDPDAELRSPTATAIASESSSRSGGTWAPAGGGWPAGGARRRLDRVAEITQLLHVAPDRARPHLEPVGQLRTRPLAPLLQEREES